MQYVLHISYVGGVRVHFRIRMGHLTCMRGYDTLIYGIDVSGKAPVLDLTPKWFTDAGAHPAQA